MLRRVEIIIRDVPLDTERDPFQWGNGIVNFGTQTRVGRPVERTFTELSEDAVAGATSITVREVPPGWAVGDTLLLPDMAPPATGPRHEEGTTITAIEGHVLTLSRPLAFARQTVSRPDGTVIVRPRVADVTRSFVVRSENPAGTRGHTVNIGAAASWDIRGNQFIGMGRTQAVDLDSTTVDAAGTVVHIGTNQIAKYASHDHHAGTSVAVRNTIGNSFDGTGGSKWAHVVHGTHDVVVEDNVCVNFQGGCFVTEDGYETRNTFRRNVAAFSFRMPNVTSDAGALVKEPRNNPGGEGAGFWFRGLHNVIEGNESWNNGVGMNLFNQSQIAITSRVPSVKGGAPDVAFNRRTMVPISVKDNVTIGNRATGLEFWATPLFYVENHIAVNNKGRNIWAATSTGVNIGLKNVQVWGGQFGIAGSFGYVSNVEVIGGYVGGARVGFPAGIAFKNILLKDLTLQNVKNIQSGGNATETFDNVMHVPLGDNPPRYVTTFGTPPSGAPPWTPGHSYPRLGHYRWLNPQRGARTLILNWQGTGQDYTIYNSYQLRSQAAWTAHEYKPEFAYYVPEAGLTMGQAWDKYGLAFAGGVIEDDAGIALEGYYAGALSRPGRDRGVGKPRAVMTLPNMMTPLPSGRKSLTFYFMATGDESQANNVVVASVDGLEPVKLTDVRTPAAPDQRRLTLDDPKVTKDGIHTVKTWREDRNGDKLAASEMTFTYRVGDVGEGPYRLSAGPVR
jgi:hypothetical protein